MLNELLKKRGINGIAALPASADSSAWQERRKEIVELLCTEEYGFMPCSHSNLTFEVLERDTCYCAGKVTLSKVLLTAEFGDKRFAFPCYSAIPNEGGKHPFFVYLSFRSNIPDRYLPMEELCDNGFAVLSFYYQDITMDNPDFASGLAGILYGDEKRQEHDGGKIAMWAWAASRVMDYAQTLTALDLQNAAVVGHSRLGKTALLAGALDERFSCAISNNSGCSGAALSRGKQGERIRDICHRFPYWFCGQYNRYIDNEPNLPFDQHFLLAAIAPRHLYVASAEQDLWADPESEYLACVAAGKAYQELGLTGFVHPDRLPVAGDSFHAGEIGYHLRKGCHYLSREDWHQFMRFMIK